MDFFYLLSNYDLHKDTVGDNAFVVECKTSHYEICPIVQSLSPCNTGVVIKLVYHWHKQYGFMCQHNGKGGYLPLKDKRQYINKFFGHWFFFSLISPFKWFCTIHINNTLRAIFNHVVWLFYRMEFILLFEASIFDHVAWFVIDTRTI